VFGFSTKLRDRLGRTSPERPIICPVRCKTLTCSLPRFSCGFWEGVWFGGRYGTCSLRQHGSDTSAHVAIWQIIVMMTHSIMLLLLLLLLLHDSAECQSCAPLNSPPRSNFVDELRRISTASKSSTDQSRRRRIFVVPSSHLFPVFRRNTEKSA